MALFIACFCVFTHSKLGLDDAILHCCSNNLGSLCCRSTMIPISALLSISVLPIPQDKFEQLARELPQLVNVGCEVRVKGLGYTVQRAKGTADEPTVGDNAMSLFRNLLCLPLIKRLRKGKVTRRL